MKKLIPLTTLLPVAGDRLFLFPSFQTSGSGGEPVRGSLSRRTRRCPPGGFREFRRPVRRAGISSGPDARGDQIFYLYRAGLKVGMVRITGQPRDNYIVADLATGDAQPGDDVRDQ